MNIQNRLVAIFIAFGASSAFAEAKDTSLGGIASTLFEGADILAQVMWAACLIVGIALFLTAFVQFQIHRSNPKLVPLTTPVTYMILGLLAICVPFASKITGFLDSYIIKEKKEKKQQQHTPVTGVDLDNDDDEDDDS